MNNGRFDAFETMMRDQNWRLIPETTATPALNVALDDFYVDEMIAGRTPPTLRFWGWQRPAVILGLHQSVSNEVNVETAREEGVTLVRRMTGGGAMFAVPEGVITYSLILPESIVAGVDRMASFELLDRWAVHSLKKMGVEASYAPINDIVSPSGKIGGAAQARRRGVVLHHTMIAYRFDTAAMVQVLRIGKEKLSDKGVRSAEKRVSPLHDLVSLPREAIIDQLINSFDEFFGLRELKLRPEEIESASRLVESRYGTEAWTFRIP